LVVETDLGRAGAAAGVGKAMGRDYSVWALGAFASSQKEKGGVPSDWRLFTHLQLDARWTNIHHVEQKLSPVMRGDADALVPVGTDGFGRAPSTAQQAGRALLTTFIQSHGRSGRNFRLIAVSGICLSPFQQRGRANWPAAQPGCTWPSRKSMRAPSETSFPSSCVDNHAPFIPLELLHTRYHIGPITRFCCAAWRFKARCHPQASFRAMRRKSNYARFDGRFP
jgi:hypothetical protein